MSKRNRVGSPNRPHNGKLKDIPMDDLLKQIFKDDLPPDVERTMKKQLSTLRMKMEQTIQEKSRTDRMGSLTLSQFREIPWIQLFLKKDVLVAASLMMIVLGGLLQSSGFSNSLKKNLSILGTSVAVSSQINQAQSMICCIQMSEEAENPLTYSIQWLSPNLSKIKVSEEEIIIADHIKNTLHKEKHPLRTMDPLLQPIIGYLSPAELMEQMFGMWQLKNYEQRDECQWGTFTVSLPEENAVLEATVDLCTYLPLSIKKIHSTKERAGGELIMNVQYSWNEPISSETFSPKISEARENT
jgi:hypothetical protein